MATKFADPRILSPQASILLLDAEIRTERTVALMRMAIGLSAIVAFYGIVAPTLAPESPIYRQIPYIALYSVGFVAVGAVSYFLARPGRYRPWMTWLFNTSDLIFWLVLMASAIFNFAVPGDYFVATPPAVAIFAVLALVSLRNNPWLLAYALAFMVVALIGLYIVAPQPAPAPPVLAPETDILFHAPQNIVRLVILTLAGLTLVYAANRTRALLGRAVDQTVQRMNLSRYLPAQIGDRIAQFDESRLMRGTQQNAAVMFVDIRGFTTMSEAMEPADISRFLGEFRAVVSAEIHAHHGIVDKFIGDSVMAVFGAPESHGNDAANCVDCAVAILAALDAWNRQRHEAGKPPVAVGIGAHWGRVFCGAIGDRTRLEFTVLGDTVNVASRLEALTKETGHPILVSRSLLVEQAGRDGRGGSWVELREHAIRGHSGRIRLFGRRS